MLALNPLKVKEEKSVVQNFDEHSLRALDFSLLDPKLHEIDWRKDRLSSSFEEFPSILILITFRAIDKGRPQ